METLVHYWEPGDPSRGRPGRVRGWRPGGPTALMGSCGWLIGVNPSGIGIVNFLCTFANTILLGTSLYSYQVPEPSRLDILK